MNSNSRELILAVVACLVCSTTSHVALTFPPARTFDLDFLDTSRTPGPCGMPKGKTFFLKVYVEAIINCIVCGDRVGVSVSDSGSFEFDVLMFLNLLILLLTF